MAVQVERPLERTVLELAQELHGRRDYLDYLAIRRFVIRRGIQNVFRYHFKTEPGIYMLELMDQYAAGFPFLLIALVEILIVSYVYGEQTILTHRPTTSPPNRLRLRC